MICPTKIIKNCISETRFIVNYKILEIKELSNKYIFRKIQLKIEIYAFLRKYTY